MTEAEQNQSQDGGAEQATGAQERAAPEGTAAGQKGAEPVSLQAEVSRLEGERRDLNERMLRIAADYENYKRRSRREMEEAGLRGMEGLLREILPVLDNLDRALDAASRATDTTAGPGAVGVLLDGVRMVQRQFLGALDKVQVKTFEAQGKPFDPAFHEAVQQIESDSLEPGTVATVFQRGYTAGGRLLRPALVAVVRGRPAAAAAEPSSEANGHADEHRS